jgi:hypothetical protein
MEAGTGGTPATTAQDQIGAALDTLKGSVEEMKTRVDGDLGTLRSELEAAQARGEQIDPAVIIQRITEIQTTVTQIDTAVVVEQPPADTPPVEQPPVDTPPADTGSGDTAPVGDETGATGADAEAPADATVGDQGAQETAPPLYVYDGDVSQADTGAFSPAGVQTPDGQPLFTYSGDVPGGAPQGDNIGGVWHVYQGPTVAAQ